MEQSPWPPVKAVPTPPDPEPPITQREALTIVGVTIVFLTFAPPLAVILWRIATGPWL